MSKNKTLRMVAFITVYACSCTEFYRGLKRYGVATELVIYPREGHGIREEKHQLDLLKQIVEWFDRYVAPPNNSTSSNRKVGSRGAFGSSEQSQANSHQSSVISCQ